MARSENCILVNRAHAIDFEDRFVHRINLVGSAPGFIRNEVRRPSAKSFDHASGQWTEGAADAESGVYRIATLWETMEHFINWTESPSFAKAHASRPPQDSECFIVQLKYPWPGTLGVCQCLRDKLAIAQRCSVCWRATA